MENSTTETIGCDLGDKMSDVCVMNAAGHTRRARVASTRKGMTTFFSREPAHVVIEVGGHSRWVSELLEGLGHRVTIANARRVKLISASDNKTDEYDAELLARLGRADARLLAPMVHRSSALQADLAIAKARDTLVARRARRRRESASCDDGARASRNVPAAAELTFRRAVHADGAPRRRGVRGQLHRRRHPGW